MWRLPPKSCVGLWSVPEKSRKRSVVDFTHRKLDPEEFRGFALAHPKAPLIFGNGSDSKPAQMFTIAHELAHIALGQPALSDAEASAFPDEETERYLRSSRLTKKNPIFRPGSFFKFEMLRDFGWVGC